MKESDLERALSDAEYRVKSAMRLWHEMVDSIRTNSNQMNVDVPSLEGFLNSLQRMRQYIQTWKSVLLVLKKLRDAGN